MSLSLNIIRKTNTFSPMNDVFILNKKNKDSTIEKIRNSLNSKNSFYQKENTEEVKRKINKDLQILNFIYSPSTRKSSARTVLTDNLEEIYNYNLNMIEKYKENYNEDLSFISDFDLEEEPKDLNDSFNSNDSNITCEEQIEIKSSNRKIFLFDDEDHDIQLEKEWNNIKKSLLDKK
jgi:flagellin-specific chaperone FliS